MTAFGVATVYELTARPPFGSWDVFLDLGFRSFALHTAFPKDTFAAGNARTGDWRYTFVFSERCNDYGND